MFRQSNPATGFTIEEGTPAVPADGRYHVLDGGVVRFSYRSLNDARRKYRALQAIASDA